MRSGKQKENQNEKEKKKKKKRSDRPTFVVSHEFFGVAKDAVVFGVHHISVHKYVDGLLHSY